MISKPLIKLIGICAIATGGIFALYQYFTMINNEKINSTLKYIDKLHSGPVHASSYKILNAWYKSKNEYNQILQSARLNRNPDTWYQLEKKVVESYSLHADVEVMVNFYTGLYICIDNNICDKNTALDFFGSDIRSFFILHYGTIAEKVRDSKNRKYGESLVKFITMDKNNS